MTNYYRILIGLLFLIATHASHAQEISKRIDPLLDTLIHHNKAWGSVALSKSGETVYARGWGYSNLTSDLKTPNSTTTRYRIGSVTKTFTAAMILQLIEEGKLSFDTKLSQYYPELPNAAQITIKQLLNHSSGLYNFTNSPNYLDYHTQKKSKEELLQIFTATTSEFEPGSKNEYSNTNYVLLGFILEDVTGKTYEENLQSRVIERAGLTHTQLGSSIQPAKGDAYSYEYNEGSWEKSLETDMSIPGGAGAIVSTPEDINRFATALFRGQIVSSKSVLEMITLQRNYGLGIFQIPFGNKIGYGHTGGIDEFQSMFIFFPEDSLAVTCMLNANQYSLNEIIIGVLSLYYNTPYEIPNFSLEKQLDPSVWKYYEGVYSSKQVPIKITIANNGKQLTAQATGQSSFPLQATSEVDFKFDAAGIKIQFILDKDGNAQAFRLLQGGGDFLFEKETSAE